MKYLSHKLWVWCFIFPVENGDDGDEADESALDKNKNKIVASPPTSHSFHDDDEVTEGSYGEPVENEATVKKSRITAERINSSPEKYITPEEKVAAILRGMCNVVK